MSTLKTLTLLLLSCIMFSCSKDSEYIDIPIPNTVTFKKALSSYGIYQGEMKKMIPSAGYHEVELSSHLFVNYAHKQRLIKLPEGSTMTKLDGGLPDFPEGTILVKTFYYNTNENAPEQGRQIIESRLLIKSNSEWNVATYEWNTEQTEAILKNNGGSKTVSWTNKNGELKTIQYHIPSQQDCATCHQLAGKVAPIGPQLMNMNIDVVRNGITKNQLQYFQELGLLNAFDHSTIPLLPDYFDDTFTLEERGRAYFELNCAHCHNPDGYCSKKPFDFRYITPIENTNIVPKKGPIQSVMQKGKMPLIGISTLDKEGLELVNQYLNSL